MRNPFKHFYIEHILFISFLLFSLLLILFIGITSYKTVNQEVVKQTISNRSALLNEIYKQLAGKMQNVEEESLFLSTNPQVIRYLQNKDFGYEYFIVYKDLIELMVRLNDVNDAIHSVQLFAKEPKYIGDVRFNGIYYHSDLEGYEWYQQVENEDSGWVGEHEIEETDGSKTKVISFVRKVRAPREHIGTLVINIKLSNVQQTIANGTANSQRYVLDTSGQLITKLFGSSDSLMGNYTLFTQKMNPELHLKNNERYATVHLEKKHLMVWTEQHDTPWVVLDIIPWDILTKGSERVQRINIMMCIISIIAAFLISFILSRQFAKPIKGLIHVMNQMKSGKLEVRASDEYHNEFGRMNEHFNKMAARIHDLMEELNEQNRQKREAELQVLQAQINPHFIYNTLDIINWRSIEYRAHDISKMLSLLGEMLRIGLSGGSAFIKVEKEIEHLRCYMELQEIRYQDRIKFSIDVESSIKQYYVTKLIIQPFVENAFIHAFDSLEEGFIEVSGSENQDSLIFIIRDNGKGMDGSNKPSDPFNKGYGIRNVRERIELYYGKQYGVDITSILGKGTTVTIRIPKKNTV